MWVTQTGLSRTRTQVCDLNTRVQRPTSRPLLHRGSKGLRPKQKGRQRAQNFEWIKHKIPGQERRPQPFKSDLKLVFTRNIGWCPDRKYEQNLSTSGTGSISARGHHTQELRPISPHVIKHDFYWVQTSGALKLRAQASPWTRKGCRKLGRTRGSPAGPLIKSNPSCCHARAQTNSLSIVKPRPKGLLTLQNTES